MLDPRLRLRISTLAELPAFLESLLVTLLAHWREAGALLEQDVFLPLERACVPPLSAASAAVKQAGAILRREIAALGLTALSLGREGLAHLNQEWCTLRRTLHRLVVSHPAWPELRALAQHAEQRLVDTVGRAGLAPADSLSRAQDRLLQIAARLANAAVRHIPPGLQPKLRTAWQAGRPWPERLFGRSQEPAYVTVVSGLVICAYLGLALASLMIVAYTTPPLPPLSESLSKIHAYSFVGRQRSLGKEATPTPTRSPTPLPTATAQPTATSEPVLTATPIPIVFTAWDSTLPQYGGWNGAGECWGPVLAPPGTGAFAWPTDRRHLVGKDFSWRWHPGLDLGGEFDEPIYAADSGVVVYAGWNTYGYGNLVILDHGNGWHTLYAHFNSVLVACGEGVTQGQIIGLAGSTGRSTGPHLHFEMRLGGTYVNPWDYLPAP